jgi:hypothetical protein
MTFQATNIKGLVKNIETNVVINNDTNEYQSYLMQKQKIKSDMAIQEEINKIKQEMSELKIAFQSIARKCSDNV